MATTVNTLETDTEVFKGDRVVADGVERSLGDVTDSSTSLVSSIDPFGDGSLVAKYQFENDTTDLLGGASAAWVGTSSYSATSLGLGAEFNGASRIDIVASNMKSVNLKFILYDVSQDTETYLLDTRSGTGTTWVITHADDSKIYFLNCAVKIDGVNVADGEFTITKGVEYSMYVELDTIADTATVGANFASSATTFTRGIEDQVEIYNRALTDTEVNTLYTQSIPKYSADFNTPLASTPTSVYRLDHDNLTIDGTPTATTATVLDSRTGLIASGDTVLLDGVGVVCNPVVETEVSVDSTNSLTVSTATAIATYKLDGNATDLSGNYNGTATNVTYAAGKFGQGGVFNGSSSIIAISTEAVGQETKTCSLWIKLSNLSSTYYALSTFNGTYIQVGINTDGSISLKGEAANTTTNSGVITAGSWYHIAVTSDSSDSSNKVYVNGVLKGNLIVAYANIARPSSIGASHTGGSYTGFFNGSIDQVRIYNRALTPTEVTALYNETLEEYQYDLTYPTQTAPTRIALSNNDIVPTVASETFDGTDTFTRTYDTVTKTARDVEYGFVADEDVEIVQLNINQNMEP